MRQYFFLLSVLLCLATISRVRGAELSSDYVTCEIGNYEYSDLLPPRAMFTLQAGAPINFTSLDGTITASSVLLQKDSSAATYRTITSASASDTQINSIVYVNSTLLLVTVARAAALEPYAVNLVCYSATMRYNATTVLRVSPTTFWVVYDTDNELPAYTEGGLHCYHMWLTDQTSSLAGIYPTHVLEVTAATTDDSSDSTSVWFYVAIPVIAVAALLIAVMVQHCVKYHSRGYKITFSHTHGNIVVKLCIYPGNGLRGKDDD